ncbi:hypothetical protein [Gemmatimonas groenlandica]|uniref:Uncharacterized protein n=1 Tax=Gemmatimonas groenlandica TaxID=2732249 RepID=A0A6M4IRL3_9BACT|nr:hypothetical protein [Gemmatimonas groenlandica]QJR36056.1 hypothetical protein HKW67_11320 [Gemmatimonas groenlandica]
MSDSQAVRVRSRSETIAQRSVSGLCALALALQIGCFSYLPVQSTPPAPAQQIGVVINDRGRVMLGDRVGASVDRIDGKVVSRQDGSLVLDVYRVTDLRGNTATWTGERVSIPEDAILGYRARKVSKVKTLLLVGVIVLAILGTLKSGLDLFGDAATDRPGDGPQQS